MGKKHKKPSSDDVKDEKKQKTSHASSSSKSLKDDGKSITLEPCSPSQANLKIHKEKSEGFENLRPREEIRKELRNIFSSCGEVTRVFVPIECKSRLPLGFAFIDLENGEGNDKALELRGSLMGGKELKVSMAIDNGEFYGFTNFEGCDRCPRRVRYPKAPLQHRKAPLRRRGTYKYA